MKRISLIFAFCISMLVTWAYDFEVDGIYYTVSSTDMTVRVTYDDHDNEYTGSVTIPESVTYNSYTFRVTRIGDGAFSYCSSLTSVTIPESVTSIGNGAFYGCSSLTSITIPESVTSIGNSAFSYCSSLTSIIVEEGNTKYDSRDNCNAIIETKSKTLIAGCASTIIPEGVTLIGNSAFSGCSSLTSVTIPEGVTSIGGFAFSGCSSLTSITLPEGVTSIGEHAFDHCSSLTSVTIPESVTSIGNGAFSYCSSLTSVTIPESVTSIGDGAFFGCSSLTSIIVEEGNTKYDSRDNCNAIIETKSKTLIAGCASTIIPEGVTLIGNSAFFGCSSLTSVTIPEGVTSIGEHAFSYCSSLTSVTIPESVTSIVNGAFSGCSSLTSITIPEGVTSIGNDAFSFCSGLTSITIPKGVTSIGDGVFSNCSSLTSITIPKGVTSIGDGAFSGCWNLTSITIPEGVTSIGDGAFSGCWNLTSITIPEGVTSIGNEAFSHCSVSSITIPESVASIGENAFSYCCSLTSITCKAMAPPIIYDDAFFFVDNSIPVYVPAPSVDAYKSAEYWSEFTNIQPIASELPSVVYLKNVGSGKFLTAANWWGTCASLGEHGLDMTLAQLPNGKYTIDTQIKGSESNYFLGKIGEKLYMDATSTEWMIEDQGNGRYTLSLDGTYYMGFDGTSVVSENLTNSADANAQWQLLTREDLITEMKYATMASPVDATFYIRGANFSRQDLRNSAWIGEPSIGGWDENFCAEKWNSGICTVYQELKDLPNGMYKLKVQGFYRMGGHDDAVSHRNEGTENYDVKFFANDASIPVMSVMDEAGKLSDVGVAYGNYGNAPSDRVHATQFFNKGYYQHEFYFTVTDGTAVVGIVNNSGLLDDWMCFDNFELYYCGEAAVILDSQTSYSQVEDKQYASITYTRNFKNANWQALYVPFEIPLTEEFLDDFEIAYINDVHQFDDDNNGDIDRTEVEAIKKVSGTLEANYPYMIRAKVAGEKTITVTDATLYASEENSIDCSSVFSTYTFRGAYKKIPAVQLPKEEGYYALSGGSWKQYSSDATSSLGAFRIYMKVDSRNANMAVQTNTIRMRVIGADDEYADDTTGIDNAQLMMDDSQQIIYDLQGRRITNTANLKGLYIMNGKKVLF